MDENSVASNLSEREPAQTLVTAWDRLLKQLPEDWSDLLIELELRAEEPYELVAPIVSALNPERCHEGPGFRFRVGRAFGYGSAVSTVERCLRSLDERVVQGRLRLLSVLAQRRALQTQGPVWRLTGRSL